jgi:hypothetical protein
MKAISKPRGSRVNSIGIQAKISEVKVNNTQNKQNKVVIPKSNKINID